MSVQHRKIGYFSIDFEKLDERSFDVDLLRRLLTYMKGLSGEDRIFSDNKFNKAVDIESIEIYEKQKMELTHMCMRFDENEAYTIFEKAV